MKYDFDSIIERDNTNSVKWDVPYKQFGRRDIIPLWVADMDFKSPQPVIDKLVERAQHGVFGYTMKDEGVYASITGWNQKRHGFHIKPEWICFTPGIVTALSMAVLAYTEPGDGVIVQTPVYHPFFSCVENNGRRIVENKLIKQDDTYTMDFEGLENSITPDVKMLILCNPHNPLGRVWTREELLRLGEIAVKHNLIIAADEIHSDIIYKGSKHISIASLSQELQKRTVTCMAPSKTFNVAGLSTSYVIIPDESLRKRYVETKDCAEVDASTVFGLTALKACYEEGEGWLQQLLDYLEGNAQLVCEYISNNIPGVKAYMPQGTYLMWIDFTGLGLSQAELSKVLIEKAGVFMNDGKMFRAEEGFMRMNIGTQRSRLLQALRQIEEAVRRLRL